MTRYLTEGTYRIYHNAKSLDEARRRQQSFARRMTDVVDDGALSVEAQFDGTTRAVIPVTEVHPDQMRLA